VNLRVRFLEGPVFDGALLLGAPLLSLLLGWLVAHVEPDAQRVAFMDLQLPASAIFLRTIIHAHLVIVFLRSHANPDVFRRHKVRFTVVPLALLVATTLSQQLLAVVLVVTTYWDAYHSSLQTFGIGRIYDQRAGANVEKSRNLDIWVNHAIYLGPFLAGPVWAVAAAIFAQTHELGATWLDPVGALVLELQPVFFGVVVVLGPLVGAWWTWDFIKRARAGERLSALKPVLLVSTAVTSIWAWGFNGFGEALLIVNVFHAVQYFAIVWWSERDNMGRVFGTHGFTGARALTAFCFLVIGVGYGFWFGAVATGWSDGWVTRFVLALTNVVALMHFWYDGFVWSVRKGHVRMPT
jgi:hypothetical protein